MKAIVLLSGGLDSILATRLVIEQGIEIEAVSFQTVFSHHGSGNSESTVDKLGIKLKVFDISKGHLEIIKNPRHGYGSNLNPCIDCRIFMFKKALEYMEQLGASFIVTGEVLGERPMSQRREAMNLIDRESGLEGIILRPLSAKLLTETIPEKEGWVNREKLFYIKGRSRQPQIKLAKELGIYSYPNASGGCLLTDKNFSNRLRDLMKYNPGCGVKDIEFLKLGRHFRLTPFAKLIVGRNEKENNKLAEMAGETDLYFTPHKVMEPDGIGIGIFGKEEVSLSSQIISRYSDRNGNESIKVSCWNKRAYSTFPRIGVTLIASPIEEKKLSSLRI